MHNSGIVHADLKPDNILTKVTVTGDYTTKLIDFDNSYFSGTPPTMAEDMIGDMVYFSPEMGLYIAGNDSIKQGDLQCSSDIFALGLIYHQYLTGKLPGFDQKKYSYPYVAVINGGKIEIDGAIPPRLAELIRSMLLRAPKDRPTIELVFSQLKRPDILSAAELTVASAAPDSSKGKLKGTLVKKNTDEKTVDPAPSSKLRGTLLNPKKER